MFGTNSVDSVLKTFDKAKRQLDEVAEMHAMQLNYHEDRIDHHKVESERHSTEIGRAKRIREKIAALIA